MYRCLLCDSTRAPDLHSAREMMYGTREPFTYAECLTCGSLQITEVPIDLARHYPAGYYSFNPQVEPIRDGIKRRLRRARVRSILTGKGVVGKLAQRIAPDYAADIWRWMKPTGASVDSRILDVGCGGGELLQVLRFHGFDQLEGIDPFIPADVIGLGLHVHKGFVEDMSGQFDLVMSHHSFEHVPDPAKTLPSMASLAPTVLIRLPVAGSLAWDMYGTDWVELDAPRHLFLPTVAGMAALVQRCGLRIKSVTFEATPFEFVGSEQYRDDIHMLSPKFQRWDAFAANNPDRVAEIESLVSRANAEGTAARAGFVISH